MLRTEHPRTWQNADVNGNGHRSVINGDVDFRNHSRPYIILSQVRQMFAKYLDTVKALI